MVLNTPGRRLITVRPYDHKKNFFLWSHFICNLYQWNNKEINNKSGSCAYDNHGSIHYSMYSIIFHIMYNIIINLKDYKNKLK
jgi:hypothetical protein